MPIDKKYFILSFTFFRNAAGGMNDNRSEEMGIDPQALKALDEDDVGTPHTRPPTAWRSFGMRPRPASSAVFRKGG
jgi:hypothetical protein